MTGDKQKNEINLLFVHTQTHTRHINKPNKNNAEVSRVKNQWYISNDLPLLTIICHSCNISIQQICKKLEQVNTILICSTVCTLHIWVKIFFYSSESGDIVDKLW